MTLREFYNSRDINNLYILILSTGYCADLPKAAKDGAVTVVYEDMATKTPDIYMDKLLYNIMIIREDIIFVTMNIQDFNIDDINVLLKSPRAWSVSGTYEWMFNPSDVNPAIIDLLA